MIFDYPEPREQRRHGPAGYTEYKYYRPWLRDEFVFRCVYCLKRETWGQVTFDFELDHFKPQSLDPQLSLDYMNLVYACRRCNAVKRDQTVADPLLLLRSSRVATLVDGSLRPHDIETQRLIRQLDLNSPKLKNWRVMWMRSRRISPKIAITTSICSSSDFPRIFPILPGCARRRTIVNKVLRNLGSPVASVASCPMSTNARRTLRGLSLAAKYLAAPMLGAAPF